MSTSTHLATKDTVKRHGLNVWFDGGENDAEPNIDIILVQGLNAHPYYTWVGRTNSSQASGSTSSGWTSWIPSISRSQLHSSESEVDSGVKEIFWPQELLPQHFPQSRIATYSYLSDWRSRELKTDIRQCGEQLLNVLSQNRQDKARRRPLVFVGHSLGGLVIQQALVIADHGDDFVDIRECVAGAIFLGAPMQGCDAARFADWFEQATGNDQPLLKLLHNGSSDLLALSRDFWSSYGKLPITCFFEKADSKIGPLSLQLVSDQSSSMLGKRRMYLNADHSHLNKFSGAHDENFQLFLLELMVVVEHAAEHNSKYTLEEPSYMLLPFSRDDRFVNRPEIMKKLQDAMTSKKGCRVALIGFGGFGKSQLAIELAYRLRENSPATNIFWVNASSPERFKASYRHIAAELQLSGFEDPKVNHTELVNQWLRRSSNKHWLIILDNMDDLRSPQSHDDSNLKSLYEIIRKYVPDREGGTVLVTSRDRQAALDIVGCPSYLVEVHAMTELEAKEVLNNKLGSHKGSNDERKQLISALEGIPLALTQAAAYINRRQRMTVAKYLELLNDLKKKETHLLRNNERDLRRDGDRSNSVMQTWQITFEKIMEQHGTAAHIMSCMSLFDGKNVPDFLIRATILDDDFEEAIDVLLGYAVISIEPNNTSFSMHRLVQDTTLTWLEDRGDLDDLIESALGMLLESHPENPIEDWRKMSILEPHSQFLISHKYASRLSKIQRGFIQRNRAEYFAGQGLYQMSASYARQSVEDLLETLGAENVDTFNAQLALSRIYAQLRLWKDAENLQLQVIRTSEKLYGPEHFVTLVCLPKLSWYISSQDRKEEALQIKTRYLNRCLKLIERGKALSDVELVRLIHLGTMASTGGQGIQDEILLSKTLDLVKDRFGEENHITAFVMFNLGRIYLALERHRDAERICRLALKVEERIHDEDWILITGLKSNLAIACLGLKQFDKAEELLQNALRIAVENYGPSSRKVLDIRRSLAFAYRGQKRQAEANQLWHVAYEQFQGEGHPPPLESLEIPAPTGQLGV